jgi:Flp pilus assembly pilin Flp
MISIAMPPLLLGAWRFARDNSGGAAVEYVVLTVVIAAVLMAASPLVGKLSELLAQLQNFLAR